MNNQTIFLLIFLFLSSCGYYPPQAKYVLIADKVRNKASEKLAKKHCMFIIATIDGMMDQVNKLGVMFELYQPLKKDEAREIIVDCVIEFLDDINNNLEIRPYLVNYPFTLENIEIAIFPKMSYNVEAYDPYINVVSNIKGKIKYATVSPEDTFKYKMVEYEDFEEALRIVQGNALQ